MRQHYIGDIGLLGTKVAEGDDMVEGYHVFLGGGYGPDQDIGREIYRGVKAEDLPEIVERMLRGYLSARRGPKSHSTSSPSGTRLSNSKTCSPRRTLYQVEVQ